MTKHPRRPGALFPVVRDIKRRLYCGPTAICAVTGLPASEVLGAIDKSRGSRAYNDAGKLRGVRGMSIDEVVGTLSRLGFSAARLEVAGEPTFAAYLKDLRSRRNCTRARIIRIRGHFLAVSAGGTQVCDTLTQQPVAARHAPKRRARVLDEILVFARKAGRA